MNIGIIGGGVMGQVIISSLLKKNVVSPGEIMISDLNNGRLVFLRNHYNVEFTTDNRELLEFSDIVLFCVKPQKSPEMMAEVQGGFRADQVIVSIMAGVSIGTMERLTGHNAIVRAMPNIPARIGEGMTVWMASPQVNETSCMIVKMIFQAFGLERRVDDEDLVDAATAVSGSGPAYIFYVAENLVNAAMELGFNSEDAQILVQQTFRGAMDLWHKEKESPETLRRSVTSKAGTTEAALKDFKKNRTPEIFSSAIRAAYVRAGQLREVADGKPDPANAVDEKD